MYNRVSDRSTRPNQADEPSGSADSYQFAQAMTDLAQRESPPCGELSDKMGLCCSKPQTSNAIIYSPSTSEPSTSSLSSSSNPSSPARPIRPLFEYRTAELSGANVNGICVGLAAEWLLNLPSSPSSRMRALRPGTQNHSSAAMRQQRYEDLKRLLRRNRAEGSHDLQAKSTMLREAGLEPFAQETRYRSGTSCIEQIVNEVADDRSIYFVSLRFAAGGAHTIVTSTSNGMTTLFDPNYGEFTVRSDQMGELFNSLADRYRNPNRHDISTVVTLRMT
ncbi:YopT-type cysteine protease domain-containing protein [Bradyrhizobium sp. CCBAU 51765]|uniref:YopT-type cysteine protease domain-containing protein n=1 Tax=Bradyrhizobium sp. CCBAU 51765 TaxID=1325102 RepID=UPI001887BDEC|nr:peptidase C58 [Bradyrhizobium sp. CCBAU 51765]